MAYNTSPSAVSLLTKANTSRAFTQDPDSGMLSPLGVRDGSWEKSQLLCCDSSQTASSRSPISGGDWFSDSTITTKLVLPGGFVRAPSLKRNTWIHWEVLGDYTNPTPNNTTIEAQLLVDAVGVGTAFSWVQNAAVTSPGIFFLQMDLRCVGNYTDPRHFLTASLRILDSTGAAIIGGAASNTELHKIITLDSLQDHFHDIQVQKVIAGAGTLLAIHSISAVQFVKSSGF